MQSYCAKCKTKTDDKDSHIVEPYRKSTCVKCGSKKSTIAKGGRIPKKKKAGGRLAYPGEYFAPVEIDPVYKFKHKKQKRPNEYVYKNGQAQAELGGALVTQLPPDFDPLHPVIPRNVDIDFQQGIYSGHELPTGVAGGSGLCTQDIEQLMMPLEIKQPIKKPKFGSIEGKASVRSRGPQPKIFASGVGPLAGALGGCEDCGGTCGGAIQEFLDHGLAEAFKRKAMEAVPAPTDEHAWGTQGDEPFGVTMVNVADSPCVIKKGQGKTGKGVRYL